MKLFHSKLFVSVIILSLTACGGGGSETNSSDDITLIKPTYTVTTNAIGDGGTIEPLMTEVLEGGSAIGIRVYPDDGYRVQTLTGCNVPPKVWVASDSLGNVHTGSINEDCEMTVIFRPDGTGDIKKAKIDKDGNQLPNSANQYSCTIDYASGIMKPSRKSDGSLLDSKWTYMNTTHLRDG